MESGDGVEVEFDADACLIRLLSMLGPRSLGDLGGMLQRDEPYLCMCFWVWEI